MSVRTSPTDRPTYFLSSLESARFGPVRACHVLRSLAFDTGKPAIAARIEPGVIGQDVNRGSDVETVVLTARHEGASVDPVSEFPCFVFIAIPREGLDVFESPVAAEDLEIIGWGELYRTHEDAAAHVFNQSIRSTSRGG